MSKVKLNLNHKTIFKIKHISAQGRVEGVFKVMSYNLPSDALSIGLQSQVGSHLHLVAPYVYCTCSEYLNMGRE